MRCVCVLGDASRHVRVVPPPSPPYSCRLGLMPMLIFRRSAWAGAWITCGATPSFQCSGAFLPFSGTLMPPPPLHLFLSVDVATAWRRNCAALSLRDSRPAEHGATIPKFTSNSTCAPLLLGALSTSHAGDGSWHRSGRGQHHW